jgi:hypothetical protein
LKRFNGADVTRRISGFAGFASCFAHRSSMASQLSIETSSFVAGNFCDGPIVSKFNNLILQPYSNLWYDWTKWFITVPDNPCFHTQYPLSFEATSSKQNHHANVLDLTKSFDCFLINY